MSKNNDNLQPKEAVVSTDSLKLQALSYLDEMTEANLPKNAWILATGGFGQVESAIILGVSQATISNILSGKYKRSKNKAKKGTNDTFQSTKKQGADETR